MNVMNVMDVVSSPLWMCTSAIVGVLLVMCGDGIMTLRRDLKEVGNDPKPSWANIVALIAIIIGSLCLLVVLAALGWMLFKMMNPEVGLGMSAANIIRG